MWWSKLVRRLWWWWCETSTCNQVNMLWIWSSSIPAMILCIHSVFSLLWNFIYTFYTHRILCSVSFFFSFYDRNITRLSFFSYLKLMLGELSLIFYRKEYSFFQYILFFLLLRYFFIYYFHWACITLSPRRFQPIIGSDVFSCQSFFSTIIAFV